MNIEVGKILNQSFSFEAFSRGLQFRLQLFLNFEQLLMMTHFHLKMSTASYEVMENSVKVYTQLADERSVEHVNYDIETRG